MITLRGDERLSSEKLMNLVGKINGIVYARVSTTDQAEKGHSIDSQIDRCVERAKTKFKYQESELLVLIEPGGMGDDPNRPALNYAIHLLEKGLGKKLIVLHPDRLTRDNTLQGVVSRRIWSLGVDIEFVEFEVDPTNPESMLMYNIQGSIAQYQKAKILANSKRGRIQKAKKGEFASFKRLYGYTFNTVTDKPEINPEERDVLLRMKDMLLYEGVSCNQMAKIFSREGIPAPNGDAWYQTTISRILKNEDYTGVFYYGKTQVVQANGKKKQVPRPKEEWIAIPIPSIWDNDTRQQILERLEKLSSKGKGRKTNDFLLKGVVHCGTCGSSAGSGRTSKIKSGILKYYTCHRKMNKGYVDGKKRITCDSRGHRQDVIDDYFWNWFVKQFDNPDRMIANLSDRMMDNDKKDELENQLSQLNKKLDEISKEESNYILLFGKGKISEEQYDTFTKPLEEQKEALEQKIKMISRELKQFNNNVDELEQLKENMERFRKVFKTKLTIPEKREFINFFVEAVYLKENYNIVVVWKFGNKDDDGSKNVDLMGYGRGEGVPTVRHKKQNHGQTYGRRLQPLHTYPCWLSPGNGAFHELESRFTVTLSNPARIPGL